MSSNNSNNKAASGGKSTISSSSTSKEQTSSSRLEYLDGLRGLLCLVVVLHHFRCGFDPCHVFGPSNVEFVSDVTICDDAVVPSVFLSGLTNGKFAVCAFLVLSGAVLYCNGAVMSDTKWKVAVIKRYFRLALPCAAAALWSYILGGFTIHEEAATITKSRWLDMYSTHRPSPTFGLLSQMVWGICVHGSSLLNNAFWSMSIELFGSYLVFGIVMVLTGCSTTVRRRLLIILILFLLGSSTQTRSVIKVTMPVRLEDGNKTDVSINPIKEGYIFKNSQTSAAITDVNRQLQGFSNIPLDPWYKPANKTLPTGIKSMKIVSEIQKHYLNPDKYDSEKITILSQPTLVRTKVWTNVSPYIWYITFVTGAYIADTTQLFTRTSNNTTKLKYVLLVLAVFLCSGYPLSEGKSWVKSSYVWTIMKYPLSLFGLGSSCDVILYTIGSWCLIHLISSSTTMRKIFSSTVFLFLGRISFALYLTHVPIIYTLTSYLFIIFYDDDTGYSQSTSAVLALICSLPVMSIVAIIFYEYVDKPSIRVSGIIGRSLLGFE